MKKSDKASIIREQAFQKLQRAHRNTSKISVQLHLTTSKEEKKKLRHKLNMARLSVGGAVLSYNRLTAMTDAEINALYKLRQKN